MRLKLFDRLQSLLYRWSFSLGLSKPSKKIDSENGDEPTPPETTSPIRTGELHPPVNHQAIYETAKMQWQFGDWDSLAKLARDIVAINPQRAQLASWVAVAHQQLNSPVLANEFGILAKIWGCDRSELAKVLVSGLHNTMGRMAALTKNREKALRHLYDAAALTGDYVDTELLARSRVTQEFTQLGLLGEAAEILKVNYVSKCGRSDGIPDENKLSPDVPIVEGGKGTSNNFALFRLLQSLDAPTPKLYRTKSLADFDEISNLLESAATYYDSGV